MGERRKLAEKRQIFRQSSDTRKLSTQAPELLAYRVTEQIYIRQAGFRRRIVFDGNTLKEKTANYIVFLSTVIGKDHSLQKCALYVKPYSPHLYQHAYSHVASFHMYIKMC